MMGSSTSSSSSSAVEDTTASNNTTTTIRTRTRTRTAREKKNKSENSYDGTSSATIKAKKQQQQQCYDFCLLPVDVWSVIFSFFPQTDTNCVAYKLRLVSRAMYHLTNALFWKIEDEKWFCTNHVYSATTQKSFHEFYEEHANHMGYILQNIVFGRFSFDVSSRECMEVLHRLRFQTSSSSSSSSTLHSDSPDTVVIHKEQGIIIQPKSCFVIYDEYFSFDWKNIPKPIREQTKVLETATYISTERLDALSDMFPNIIALSFRKQYLSEHDAWLIHEWLSKWTHHKIVKLWFCGHDSRFNNFLLPQLPQQQQQQQTTQVPPLPNKPPLLPMITDFVSYTKFIPFSIQGDQLVNVVFEDCLELQNLCNLVCLKYAFVKDCKNFEHFGPCLPSLETIHVGNCGKFDGLFDCPKLSHLTIQKLCHLEDIRCITDHGAGLDSLTICDYAWRGRCDGHVNRPLFLFQKRENGGSGSVRDDTPIQSSTNCSKLVSTLGIIKKLTYENCEFYTYPFEELPCTGAAKIERLHLQSCCGPFTLVVKNVQKEIFIGGKHKYFPSSIRMNEFSDTLDRLVIDFTDMSSCLIHEDMIIKVNDRFHNLLFQIKLVKRTNEVFWKRAQLSRYQLIPTYVDVKHSIKSIPIPHFRLYGNSNL